MPQEDIDQCIAEWEAFREGDHLATGVLTKTCEQVLKERGMTVVMLGRVESAKELVFACMRRSYYELQALRAPELEAQPKP